MRIAVTDIETNRLVNPDIIHVVCIKDLLDSSSLTFPNPQTDPKPFLSYAETVDTWVTHNGIHFDIVQLDRLLGGYSSLFKDALDHHRVIDTLVLSRLLNYRLDAGHSLEAWGERLGYPKIKFNNWDTLTDEMVTYCHRDVEITEKVYNLFLKYIQSDEWKTAIDIEHRCAYYCQKMHENGFFFDIEGCKALRADIVEQLEVLDNEIKTAFPPRSRLVREITPSLTKHGTLHRKDFKWLRGLDTGESDGCLDLTPYSAGSPFSLIEFEEFNPGSVKQIVERLNEAGWKPTERTKGHIEALKTYQRANKNNRSRLKERLDGFARYGWTVSEENLKTLPDDAPKPARTLTKRLLLDRRRSTLEEWITSYERGDGTEVTGRIHGRFNSIGTWTHRLSHSEPNQANIVRIIVGPSGDPVKGFDGGYGVEFRSMWRAAPGKTLVDVDAEGIQLRILAHYMDDERFTEALVNGSSKDGTDVHTLNQRALGSVCSSRAVAKTFIYSWLLGAGPSKTASILGCSLGEAKSARDQFLTFYPGLERLRTETIPKDASRGYFVGIDGRKVKCNSEHLMLSGYLQNGETVLMKKALDIWYNRAIANGLDPQRDFKLVDFVHDEFVVEAEEDTAEEIMSYMVDSIREAGEFFNLKCPHQGNGHIGYTWAEVH